MTGVLTPYPPTVTVASPSITTSMENTRPGDGLTVEQLLDALQERFELMYVGPSPQLHRE